MRLPVGIESIVANKGTAPAQSSIASGQNGLQLHQPFCGSIILAKLRSPLDLLDGRMQRRIAEEGRALVLHSGVILSLHVISQPSHQPRLAYSGFTRQQHNLTLSLSGLRPQAHEDPKLFRPPDQRCCTPAQSFETAPDRPSAGTLPS